MAFTDADRRQRLVRRHHLGRDALGVIEAVKDVAAMHSSDPVTPFLACRARVPAFEVPNLEHQLYELKSLWRMHTIRRTLFVVSEADVPVFEAGAAREVARRERRRLVGWLSSEMQPDDVAPWLERVSARVLDTLGRSEMATREITQAVPEVAQEVTVGSGKWTTRVPVSSRLLFLLAMEGHLVRTRTAGSWRASQYRWATAAAWRGEPFTRLSEPEGRARLAERYLATHGPATLADLKWWTGWTVKAAKEALAEIGATTVQLESGEAGWVLPGDVDVESSGERTVALLPALDPTAMGYKQRDWYLGPHAGPLFDTNGNAGPTVWVDGRVVGGWGQRRTGEVRYELLEEVDLQAKDMIEAEADALTDWMDGVVAIPRFATPLAKRLAE